MSERIPLTDLPRALNEAGYEAPTYRQCYDAALSARFPAKRGANGRWTWAKGDFDMIVESLGLSVAHAA